MWVRGGQTQSLVGVAGAYPADGFGLTVNTANSPNGQFWFNHLQFGGTGLSVALGSFSASGASQSITGVGFQPQCIIFYAVADGFTRNGAWSPTFGAATGFGATEQWAMGGHRDYLQSLGDSRLRRGFYEGSCIWQIPGVGGTFPIPEIRGTLASFDADGFTLNWTGSNSSVFQYLAFRHPTARFKAGIETQGTSNGVRSTTGFGWRPQSVVFASHGSTTTGSVVTHYNNMLGCASRPDGLSPVEEVVGSNLWAMTDNSVVDYYAYQGADRCMQLNEWTSPNWVDKGHANCAMAADGFDLTWAGVDGTARKFGYLAFEGGETWNGDSADAFFFWMTKGNATRGLIANRPSGGCYGAQVGTGNGNAIFSSWRQDTSNGSGLASYGRRTDSSVGIQQNAGGTLWDWSGYVSALYPLSGGSAVSFDKVVFPQ